MKPEFANNLSAIVHKSVRPQIQTDTAVYPWVPINTTLTTITDNVFATNYLLVIIAMAKNVQGTNVRQKRSVVSIIQYVWTGSADVL
jgi:hypothetical protein